MLKQAAGVRCPNSYLVCAYIFLFKCLRAFPRHVNGLPLFSLFEITNHTEAIV